MQRESARADDAARTERVRLSQDLHDGLQGRLLLVDQTVASLRDAIDDVRSSRPARSS